VPIKPMRSTVETALRMFLSLSTAVLLSLNLLGVNTCLKRCPLSKKREKLSMLSCKRLSELLPDQHLTAMPVRSSGAAQLIVKPKRVS